MKKLLSEIFCSLIILFVASSSVNGAALKKEDGDICIANYLKSKKVISDAFGDSNLVDGTCLYIVKATKKGLIEDLKKEFEQNNDTANYADCAAEYLTNQDFGDSMLASHIYNTFNTTLPEEELTEKQKESEHTSTLIITNALMDCEGNDELSEAFDKILSGEEDDDILSQNEDYCMRKHIVDNNLIDKSKYNLNLNPNNIDTESVDCTIEFENAKNKIEDDVVKHSTASSSSESEGSSESEDSSESKSSSDEESKDNGLKSKCILDVFRSGEYLDKTAYFDYLKELDLNDEQKAEEKEKFITIMKSLTNDIVSCIV